MPRNHRIAACAPVRLFDADGNEYSAELRLIADDDDPDRPDTLDCRLVGSGDADEWILNVERETLLRALEVVAEERNAVPVDD